MTRARRTDAIVSIPVLGGMLVCLGMSAWGWRWTHDWPTTAGTGAVGLVVGTGMLMSTLVWPAGFRTAWAGGMTVGAVLLMASAAAVIEPRAYGRVPTPVLGGTCWLIGLWGCRLTLRMSWYGPARVGLLTVLVAGWIWPGGIGPAFHIDPAGQGVSHFFPPGSLVPALMAICGAVGRVRWHRRANHLIWS
jgi:hypothetical protein